MRELFKVQAFLPLIMPILSLFIVESVEENRILNPILAYFTTLGRAAFFPLYENFSRVCLSIQANLNVRVTFLNNSLLRRRLSEENQVTWAIKSEYLNLQKPTRPYNPGNQNPELSTWKQI